ncbi:hypothetical protein MIR68_009380 [Amoeboaphelidium protococcarum]|nr:hypothetical protein MIR68_009380 [Amoeboaphelidium protococcarum]
MLKCLNKGCGREFIDSDNTDNACSYHSGPPVFHEGLKGWQCCSKRVIEFDEFLQIPGCTTGRHQSSADDDQVESPSQDQSNSNDQKSVHSAFLEKENGTTDQNLQQKPSSVSSNGKTEVYGIVQSQQAAEQSPLSSPTVKLSNANLESEQQIERDPVDAIIKDGMVCKRNGCGYAYKVGDDEDDYKELNRTCHFHPGAPVFHEGSKGWSCCSRKVLEFDEFLKIKGCQQDQHLFIGSAADKACDKSQLSQKNKAINVRHDWFQSPHSVTVSFYVKKVDKDTVDCRFLEQRLELQFKHPENGGVQQFTADLFQPIVAAECQCRVMSTKIEVTLRKANGISWPQLEKTDAPITTWTTFGITGRTGTVGSKEMQVSNDSPLLALNR